jgi:hypothetical protein
LFWKKDKLLPEKEDEIIEKVARRIVNSGSAAVALMFLEMYKPAAIFWGGMARFFSAT